MKIRKVKVFDHRRYMNYDWMAPSSVESQAQGERHEIHGSVAVPKPHLISYELHFT
jgi:hypothetical protein